LNGDPNFWILNIKKHYFVIFCHYIVDKPQQLYYNVSVRKKKLTVCQALPTEVNMRQIVIDLTNKGYICDNEFFGIQFDPRHQQYEVWCGTINPRHQQYEVWCGTIKRFSYLNAAKSYLSRLAPGWDK
jgi:hypothetical protein